MKMELIEDLHCVLDDPRFGPRHQQAQGMYDLANAVVSEAVDNVRDCQRAGLIVNGKVRDNRKGSRRQVKGAYETTTDILRLVHWLTGGGLSRWLDLMEYRMSAESICRELGL